MAKRHDDGDSSAHTLYGCSPPPKRVVAKSLALLRETISKRARQQDLLLRKREKLTQAVYAPVADLIKGNPQSLAAARALRKFDDKRLAAVKLPPRPELAFDIVSSGFLGWHSTLATPAFTINNAFGEQSARATSNPFTGELAADIMPGDGSAWVWAGVGFHFSPGFGASHVVSIRPDMIYNYYWRVYGFLGFSAHTEGWIGIHVHSYDQNWQDWPTPDMQSVRKSLWACTSETDSSESGAGAYSDSNAVTLAANSNFLIWATIETSGNDTGKAFIGYSQAIGVLRAQCRGILVSYRSRWRRH